MIRVSAQKLLVKTEFAIVEGTPQLIKCSLRVYFRLCNPHKNIFAILFFISWYETEIKENQVWSRVLIEINSRADFDATLFAAKKKPPQTQPQDDNYCDLRKICDDLWYMIYECELQLVLCALCFVLYPLCFVRCEL